MNHPETNQHHPLRYLSGWHRATRRIQDHLNARAASLDIPPAAAHLISYLGSYAPVPVGTLVDVFGLNKSTLTGMLDRLERDGFLTRAVNPQDRRSFLVDLTDPGRAAAARMRAELEAFEAALHEELDPADRPAFKRILAAVTRATARPVASTANETQETKP